MNDRNFLVFFLIVILSSCVPFQKAEMVSPELYVSKKGVKYQYCYCDESGFNYIVTFPEGYHTDGQDGQKKYPLIIFLHSMAERGNDLTLLMENTNGQGQGLSQYAVNNPMESWITVSPLCPKNLYWPLMTKKLNQWLMSITENYKVDKSRIYLTGVSMGGMGTWSFAMDYPDWFAAIAPISGGIYKPLMKEKVDEIKHIPIWVFHDKYDQEIPIDQTIPIVKKLKEKKADIRFTVYEEGKHYLHQRIFSETNLFDWFLKYRK